MKKKLSLFIALSLLSCMYLNSSQTEKSIRGTINIHFDNDFFLFSLLDRYYTNGIRVTWISPPLNTENLENNRFLNLIPFFNRPGFHHLLSFSLGHNIFTPSKLNTPQLLEEDYPYAGFLYLEFGSHRWNESCQESLEIMLGIVGPSSLAEEIQRTIHSWVGSKIPQGWHHQLRDEPALAVIYERKWKLLRIETPAGLGFELLPNFGAGLGNVYTYASSGFQLRLGWYLPRDFGIPLLSPGGDSGVSLYDRQLYTKNRGPIGIHAFILFEGKAVLRNIFLDGNTFTESHRVEKIPFMADLIFGLRLKVSRINFSFAYVVLSKQFKTQPQNHTFLSLNLSFSY